MIYLSKGFRKKLAEDEREYLAKAEITLQDGTRLTLEKEQIWGDGFSVEDAVSDDESFTALGATVINAATLVIDNTNDQYTAYDFYNADVVMSIALMIEENGVTRKETVKMGTFRVDDPKYNEVTITLSMLDMMEQFDRPYKESTLIYPATLISIVRDACTNCAVTLETLTFPHDDFIIQERPTDEACTFREVIGWVATIAGCFAKCNRDGRLEIKWFNTSALETNDGTDGGIFDEGTPYYTSGDSVDGGTFNPWNNGGEAEGGDFTTAIPYHYIGGLYTQNICVDETVITGVTIEVEDKSADAAEQKVEYKAGTSGYIIQISNNPLITKNNAQTILAWLGQQLIGLRFRKSSVTHTDDPAIEAGDVGLLFDSRNHEYPILITRTLFEIGGPQTVVCGSETPSHNSATRYTEATKNYVESRKLLKEQKDSYEQALEDLAEDIENNAHGLYAEEIEDPDNPGAYIYCLHDKPDMDDSAVQIRLSTVGIVVTANGTAQSPTWYGLRVNGDLITRIMNTIGIDFDWGVGGELTIKKGANETFYANADTGVVRIVADSFSLSNGDTINSIAQSAASTAATNAVNGQTQQSIFNKLTNNGQAQGIYLQNGKLYLNFAYAVGQTLKLGGSNNANGLLEIYDANGTRIGRLDNTGADITGKLKMTGDTTFATIGTNTTYVERQVEGFIDREAENFQFTVPYDSNGNKISSRTFVKGPNNDIQDIYATAKNSAVRIIALTTGSYIPHISSSSDLSKIRGIREEVSYSSSDGIEYELSTSVGWSSGYDGRFYFNKNSFGIKTDSCGVNPSALYDSSHKLTWAYEYIDSTTFSYGTLRFDKNKIAFQSSSSIRYKHDIREIRDEALDPHRLLALTVVQFEWNEDHSLQYADMRGKTIPGIIAEDVEEIYPSAVIHNEDGEVESWDERRILPGMLALIQEQDKIIKQQQERLDDLERKLESLTKLVEAYTMEF